MSKFSKFSKQVLSAGSALQAVALISTGMVMATAIATPAMAQDITSGSLTGTVLDAKGAPVAGASITVESSERGISRTTSSSSNGNFSLVQLPVGNYEVTVKANGFETTRSENVSVDLGGTNYDFTVSSSSGDDSIVVVGNAVRKVDFSGTATGTVFNVQDTVEKLPVPRNITSIQLLTPQATSGDAAFGGVSIGGSSVAENIFYINGMNVTNFRTFVGGTTVPFEFYDQVQVKTGGYQAEFGRNTGGAVIAVTRSGSNEAHGGFNAYVSPSSLFSKAPNTFAANNSRDKRTQAEGNIWASGPIIKDRLFFFAFYNPRYFTQSDTARSSAVDVNGAPTNVFSDTNTTTRKTSDPFFGGKLDLNLFEGHRVEATYFSDTQDERVEVNGAQTTNFSGGDNLIFKYSGQFADFLTLSALYGKSKFNQTSAGSSDAIPWVLDGRLGSLTYVSGNPNGTIDTGNDQRENFRVDADISFNALGEHKIRAGFDYERLKAENFTIYSGNIYNRYFRAGASGALNGLIAPNTDYVRVRNLQSGGSFKSENTAFYIQDSWDVTPRLNLSLGVRNDRFVNKDGLGANFTDLKNQWAPRIGFNFDPTGEKRTRISGFYGRYFLPVAANTNIRLAGSELFTQDWYQLSANYSGNLQNPVLGTAVLNEILSPGGVSPVSTLVTKNLKPQYMDEFILGGETKFGQRIRVGVNLVYRNLGAVLEDFDLDGSGTYASIIGAFCQTQTLGFCNPTTTPTIGSGGYVLYNPGNDIIVDVVDANGALQEVTLPNTFLTSPKAKRKYYAAEFKVDRTFDGVWGLSGSYVWSRSKGNYEGGVKSDNGQDDTGLTQDFDELGWNDGADGFLPNHREHTFKLFGNFKPVERVNLGFNALLQSPRKFGCIGTYPLADGRASTTSTASWYCNSQILAGNITGTVNQPVGRGTVFESDWNKRLDISMDYTIPVAGTGGLTLRADVFNVFNFQSKLDFDENGDRDTITSINYNYRQVTAYQAPRSVRFSISAKF
jgi:hypothetical protein